MNSFVHLALLTFGIIYSYLEHQEYFKMAEDKKSFILYADLIHTVRKLPKDKAGELFMTILSYVNDENPVVEDVIIDLVFEPVKQQLKRDLKHWEEIKAKRSDAGKIGGKKSGEARKTKQTKQTKQMLPLLKNGYSSSEPDNLNLFDSGENEANEANEAVNVNGNVNVNVNVTDTHKEGACEELKLEKDILQFFKFNEIANFDKLKLITDFTYSLSQKNKLKYFTEQFQFYKKFKELSGERVHNFMSFIGTQKEAFTDGRWDDANWQEKFLVESKKQNGNKNKRTNPSVGAITTTGKTFGKL